MPENQTAEPASVEVTKSKTGYVTVECAFEDRIFHVEVGETGYSAYLTGGTQGPLYFSGDNDVAE